MAQHVLMVATRLLQGVGQLWHLVKRTVIVDRLGEREQAVAIQRL
jgi:hypothetical protein